MYEDFVFKEEILLLKSNLDIYQIRYPQLDIISSEWTKYIDKPKKKLYYKKESGYEFVT